MDIHSFKPYQRFLTGTLFLTFLLVGIVGSTTVYIYRSRHLLLETQRELQTVAENAARGIPADTHELVQKPGDEKTAGYAGIVTYLKAVRDGNPHIDDIYTLRPTTRDGVFTFVISAQDTADQNGDGVVEQAEVKPEIGEEYDASSLPRLLEGLARPSVDDGVTTDKWGSWISGYAPVKDATGKVIAVLGVDYSSSVLDAQRWQLVRSLILVDVFLLPIILLIAILVARFLARPYQTLARAMYDVAHGEVHKQLPIHGRRSDRVFAQLFNGMVQMIGSAKHHQNDEK